MLFPLIIRTTAHLMSTQLAGKVTFYDESTKHSSQLRGTSMVNNGENPETDSSDDDSDDG